VRAARGTLLFALLLLAAPALPASGLRVAVVQFRVDPSTYASQESFRKAVTATVEQAVRGQGPDLVVFPEYTCVFLAMLPYARELQGAAGVADGLSRVQAVHPELGTLRDVFLAQSAAAQRILAGVFAPLARRHRVTIVAGSAFVAENSQGGREELRNRAFVLGPDGRLLRAQDKVFLTDFERDVAGLSPGRIEDASPFVVAGARVCLTLCRDTFFAEWEDLFHGVDLWIDIKANAVPFTADEREDFRRALPARLPRAGVLHGITACLVGSFLDLTWEGESSVIECTDRVVRTISAATSPRAPAILRAQLTTRAF
jgi:predicted amidohydrolase